jgi:prolyl 4-hydroxylase
MYPFADAVNRFSVRRSINIQEYLPSSNGYKRWHCEVDGTHNLRRHLVFMTYLNDVSDGGETLFYHQDLAIKPEFGTTVIFPPTWTHQHKGLSSPSEHKRFLTGWFEFYNEIPKDEVDSSDKVSW